MADFFEYEGDRFERVMPGEYVKLNIPLDEYGDHGFKTHNGHIIPDGAIGIVFSLNEEEAIYTLAVYLDPKRLDGVHIIGAYIPAEYVKPLSTVEFDELSSKVTVSLWFEYQKED